MSSTIRSLLDILTSNVNVLEQTCTSNGTHIPDLQAPFHPTSEDFRTDPRAAEASSLIVAAAHQLAAILTPPPVSLEHFKSAALRVCLESNVTEILREAGTKGAHVEDIARLNGQDPRKLGQFLRILALHHIYREITPEVFTNTRISSMLDTLKPSQEVQADPEHKHDNTPGLAALASHHLDEAFKASAYAWEACSEPSTAHSGAPTASAFAKAVGDGETLWQYYSKPQQRFREIRFGIGMKGIDALQPPDAVLKAYNWKDLPSGSLVVDVGGGIGSVAQNIAKSFPELYFVIQDLLGPIEDGKKWWSKNMPEALSTGRICLEAHDFFTPQSQKNAAVFMIKQILHDWSDEYCVKILLNLRQAATPSTVLLILESIMPYACHDPAGDEENSIIGAVPNEAPAPLLANYGAMNEMGYLSDIDMCLLFNSQERTIHHFDRLLRSTGWKLTIVNRQPGDSTYMQSMEAVPF
ncbi:S-adenosyl-L-methionine-dependent methyltransferase [Lentinula edodes]|uniref:S-adenosyl-L-methionine-dependent methyltransferase n=1 Tax=Lentinula edodes TaxID=5353 RepID=UPI001E8D5BE0|nr:S-adenosyl-L-methionine-dependent methyltransferase [Lentinula edodes]KAH7874996.1 S-adenosyl-L-methionine-dependent methyltransferase [Lentinula edodes]